MNPGLLRSHDQIGIDNIDSIEKTKRWTQLGYNNPNFHLHLFHHQAVARIIIIASCLESSTGRMVR